MKKNLLITLVSLMIAVLSLTGCDKLFGIDDNDISNAGNNNTSQQNADAEEEEEEEDEEDEVPQELVVYLTLEEALPTLLDDGYKKTSEGYVAQDKDSDVESKRVVNAKGNHVTVDLSYKYSSGNSEMAKFYKEDDEAVCIMVSSFLTRLAYETDVEQATMDYTISVAGKKVREGKMNLRQAEEYQAMADEEW